MSPRLETPTMLHWRAALAALALAATAMAPLAARAQNAIQSGCTTSVAIRLLIFAT